MFSPLKKLSFLLLLFFLFSLNTFAQSETETTRGILKWSESRFGYGVSLDPVAYYYGGYDFTAWVSYYYFKLRANYSLKYPPKFVSDDFKELSYLSFGLYFDYFPFTTSKDLNGIWFSLGFENSEGAIENIYSETSLFRNYFLTASFGYLLSFANGFYLNPYFAGHLRIIGEKNVTVGVINYTTQAFWPEISFRLGYAF